MLDRFSPKKVIQPYYPTVIDIETNSAGEDIGMGIVYQGENEDRVYKQFDTIKDWFLWYTDTVEMYEQQNPIIAKRLLRIFAHNGAAFDSLKIHEITMEMAVIEKAQYFMSDSAGIGYKVKYQNMRHAVTFMDSYRLLPASLKKLCETFHVKHQKIELDGVLPEQIKRDNIDLYWEYLKHDCLSLQDILYSFWKMLYDKHGNIGDLPMTLASLALRLFRLYIDTGIMTPNNKYQKALERLAYHGGMTQCLEVGEFENVSVYDVNSMYPFVMQKYEYPTSYLGYITRTYDNTKCGLWHVRFEQSRHDIPPFIFDLTNEVSYCGEAVCTTSELEHLIKIGGTFTLIEGRIWLRTGPIFREFVTEFYEERKQAVARGDDAMAFVLKILLNSVYGKFAEREEGYRIVMASAKERIAILKTAGEYYNLGNFIAVLEPRQVRHMFVGIAAMITAYARVTLHQLIMYYVDRGFRVIYCDTDSVHVAYTSTDIPNASFIGSELGAQKVEYTGPAVYAGKKLYATQKYTKAKGVGRAIKQGKLTYQVIQKLALENGKERIYFDTFPSVKEVLGETRKAAVMIERFRTIKQTGATKGYVPKIYTTGNREAGTIYNN